MPRALFEKKGNAIWISHLDLMRLFQRAFKRAGLPLTHTQGFNPRPSVSIALPLSVGVESECELLDFDLDGVSIPCEEIKEKLNGALTEGVKVLGVYENGAKIKHLSYLDCCLTLEYDAGVTGETAEALRALFSREELLVEKKGKNGIVEQNIIPMIRKVTVEQAGEKEVKIHARVCCQNPSLNPMQLGAAIDKYLPEQKPDHVRCVRVELYDETETVFR